MNKLPLVIGAYTLCFSMFSMPVLADVSEKVEQLYSVDKDSEFSLHNINGSVKVSSWQESEIKVVGTKEADTQAALDRIIINMEQQGNSVKVETEYEKKSSSYRHHSGHVDFEIFLPKDIKTTDIDLVNGSLVISKVGGMIDADLVNGSIKVSDATGNSKLQSVNGSIKVNYQHLGAQVDEIKLNTVNGSIKLYLPDNANADVDAETMHGSLKSDFDLSVDKNLFTGKEMSGTIGSGHTQISLESVNGSIKVMNQ